MAALVGLVASLFVLAPMPIAGGQQMSIYEVNQDLGVGLNLANALEAPREGDWGLTLHESYFTAVAEAGFGHVRVPIRFSGYAAQTAPYDIPGGVDPAVVNADNLWDRIDWVIENAERNGLYVILDVHVYDELSIDVAGERVRFLAIWDQIATRYADASRRVLFELLNEPQGQFNDEPALLNNLLAAAIEVVRETNPTRPILVGPPYWNRIGALDFLALPDDPNLIVSLHFYDPFFFTHQGATWLDPVPPAPASFNANFVGVGAGWRDWSWDTSLVPEPTGLEVNFGRQFAGLAFGRPGLVAPERLHFTASGDGEIAIRCSAEDDEDHIDIEQIAIVDKPSMFAVDMATCPDDTRSIIFMVVSPEFGPVHFSHIELCETEGGCHRLIEAGEQAIVAAFARAAEWGATNDRPINVGEFGAHGAEDVADLDDRAAWTKIVTRAGRSHGFSMTYWEFGAGFGAYDVTAKTWVDPLLQALRTEAVPVQDLLVDRAGDVNCNASLDMADALSIAGLAMGIRIGTDGCSLDRSSSELNQLRADVDDDGVVDIVDALIAARCAARAASVSVCP